MRYKCPMCGSFVKDKFIFGLLHPCLSDEEIVAKSKIQRQALKSQINAASNDNWKTPLGSLTFQDFCKSLSSQVLEDEN